jgi:hypothetical protein
LSCPLPELRFCRSSIEQNPHLTTILPAATVRHRRLALRRPAHAVGDERAYGSLARGAFVIVGKFQRQGYWGKGAKVPQSSSNNENGNPLEHDPEKWIPVFGKVHAPTKGHGMGL